MIYLIIWAHFVCDFIFQTDNMAKNKSSSNTWLAKHIATYSGLLFFILVFRYPIASTLLYCIVNGAAHFATDYVTSRITKKLWAKGQVHNFFVVIGFDQAVHMTTLIVTLSLLK